jgi:hypothetical protein
MFDQPYQKTEAGRTEIRERHLPLSRSARNLLLMLDGSRPARQWIEMIKGTSEADLVFLLGHGLIAASEGGGKPAPAPATTTSTAATTTLDLELELPTPADEPAPPPPAAEASGAMGFDELYDYLTGNARKHLGLIKGYRLVLEVERCTDLVALQHQAWKLVAGVEESEGAAAAELVRAEMRL